MSKARSPGPATRGVFNSKERGYSNDYVRYGCYAVGFIGMVRDREIWSVQAVEGVAQALSAVLGGVGWIWLRPLRLAW